MADEQQMVTVTVTGTIQIRYSMTEAQALQAFGTVVPAEIATVEQANCADAGDYFISMMDGNMVSDTYEVAVAVGPVAG